MRRALILVLSLGVGLGVGAAAFTPAAHAQDRAQTLADIRQELTVLFVEIQRLRGELNTTGGALGSGSSGPILSRVDALESELRRLSSATESLQLRIDRVVNDGTNRVGDLEFRLCELEADCDIGSLGDTPRLGGDAGAGAGIGAALPPAGAGLGAGTGAGTGTGAPTGGQSLAVAEQGDFDRANAAFEAGDYAQAAGLFEAFTQTYPGGPLSAEAHFLRGQSEARQDAWSNAARAYLDAFSAAPDGARAPEALLNLGVSLNQLGQSDEACLTLGEVSARFPGSPFVAQAEAARSQFGCL